MKHIITCCGYVCAQGVPARWVCPACGTAHEPEEAQAVAVPDLPPGAPGTTTLPGGLRLPLGR